MSIRKMPEDKSRRLWRIPYRPTSIMLFLPLVIACFSGGGVDADRLRHFLNNHRSLQYIDETTNHLSGHQDLNANSGSNTGYVSDRDMFGEDNPLGKSEADNFDSSLYSNDENDPVITSTEAANGPTLEKSEKLTQIKQGQLNSKSKSTATNQKGTNLDNSESTDLSFESSSVNANAFTELEVEDITTIVREGTSPIELVQGRRGLVFCILLVVSATIFTAWQVADYPDGAYSSLCRWTVSSLAFLFRAIIFPFRMCCNFNNHEHVPLAKSDYGYKDPSMEFS